MFRTAFRLPRIRTPVIRSLFTQISSRPLLPVSAPVAPRLVGKTRHFHRSPPRLSSPPSDEARDDDARQQEELTLSQRLKRLIKSYGWYAIGVYIMISTLDLGIAFAGVNLLGAEQVSRVVASVKESALAIVHSKPPEPGREEMEDVTAGAASTAGPESLYAMLVLAYTIHKTLFLPVRVGLTAALTPRLVGWLTRRGWVGSQGAKRAATELREKIRNR